MNNLNKAVTGVTDEAEAKRLLLSVGVGSLKARGGYLPPLDTGKIPETTQAFAKRKKIKLNKPLWQAWVMEEWALLYHTHAIRLAFNFYNAFEMEYIRRKGKYRVFPHDWLIEWSDYDYDR